LRQTQSASTATFTKRRWNLAPTFTFCKQKKRKNKSKPRGFCAPLLADWHRGKSRNVGGLQLRSFLSGA
jgi:hypothetical protein